MKPPHLMFESSAVIQKPFLRTFGAFDPRLGREFETSKHWSSRPFVPGMTGCIFRETPQKAVLIARMGGLERETQTRNRCSLGTYKRKAFRIKLLPIVFT